MLLLAFAKPFFRRFSDFYLLGSFIFSEKYIIFMDTANCPAEVTSFALRFVVFAEVMDSCTLS